jgi:hypothetical protein
MHGCAYVPHLGALMQAHIVFVLVAFMHINFTVVQELHVFCFCAFDLNVDAYACMRGV